MNLKTPLPQTQIPELDDKPILLYTFYNLDPKWHPKNEYNRVFLLEPSHFEVYPISQKVLNFALELAKNIGGLKVFVGEFDELRKAYPKNRFIAKEHPILKFDGAETQERDWIVPDVSGYFESFSKYYSKCLPHLIKWVDADLSAES